MKKVLILLVAAMMLTFTAQASAAEKFGQYKGQFYMQGDDGVWYPAEFGDPSKAMLQNAKVLIPGEDEIEGIVDGVPGDNSGGAATGDGTFGTPGSGNSVRVYRRTCQGLTPIGCVYVSRNREGHVLVKTLFGQYRWVQKSGN